MSDIGPPIGRKTGGTGFNQPAQLEQLEQHLVHGAQLAACLEHARIEWIPIRFAGDARRAALAALDETDHRQLLDRFADHRPAHVELARQLLLRGHRLAGLDLAAHDAPNQGIADLLGESRRSRYFEFNRICSYGRP